MDEQTKLAFQFASDLSKQLITLSTGVVALTITFSKDILGTSQASGALRWLLASWVLYLVSVVLGIWHLMALTGLLAPLGSDQASQALLQIEWNARGPALLQILTFVIATGLIIKYAFMHFLDIREVKMHSAVGVESASLAQTRFKGKG